MPPQIYLLTRPDPRLLPPAPGVLRGRGERRPAGADSPAGRRGALLDVFAEVLAADDDPCEVLRLAMPVAADARTVVKALGTQPRGMFGAAHEVLASAFGADVAEFVAPVAAGRNLGTVAQRWREAEAERRCRLVRALLEGVTCPLTPALLARLTNRAPGEINGVWPV